MLQLVNFIKSVSTDVDEEQLPAKQSPVKICHSHMMKKKIPSVTWQSGQSARLGMKMGRRVAVSDSLPVPAAWVILHIFFGVQRPLTTNISQA